LREILIDRDNITEARFERKIRNSVVLDLKHFVPPEEFAQKVAKPLAERLNIREKELYRLLMKREKQSNIMTRPGFAVISFHIKGRKKFEIALVRTKKGARFSEKNPPVRAAFIIISTPDRQSFYLHSLMWLVQIEEQTDFEKAWIEAKDNKELREVILSSWKNRSIESLEIE
jgi:mannitol/fructose-specific phosphotransferase system IIA component (Ntr-type)